MVESNKYIHAVYDDDDTLLNAVKVLKQNKCGIDEVYTPFPVHGLDKVMGIDETRIAIMSFIYGCIGLSIAVLMINFIMIEDWPQNIGGKPSFTFFENMPSFVPVLFEMTVYFAAHLMVITFYLRSKLWPFKKAENPLPSTTDDRFLIEIQSNGEDKKIKALLKNTGAMEINIYEKE